MVRSMKDNPRGDPHSTSMRKYALTAVCMLMVQLLFFLLLRYVSPAPFDPATALDNATRVYQEELGRTPDPDGLKHWLTYLVTRKRTVEDMRRSLAASEEGRAYRSKVEMGEQFHVGDAVAAADAVREAYWDVLGRGADSRGLFNYVFALKDGRMSVEGVRAELGASEEARAFKDGGVSAEGEQAALGASGEVRAGRGKADAIKWPLDVHPRTDEYVEMLENILRSPEGVAGHIKANFLCNLPDDGRCGHDKDWFRRFERAGVHVLPVHFYSVIPHVAQMKVESFQRPKIDDAVRDACAEDPNSGKCPIPQLTGIEYTIDRQVEVMDKCSSFREELEKIPSEPAVVNGEPVFHSRWACTQHTKGITTGEVVCPPYGAIDAQVYHCMIRGVAADGKGLQAPKRVIEIGSGHSTYIAAEALKESGGELVSIEPYPSGTLREGFKGIKFQLIEQDLQAVDLSLFRSLREGDILFIDSTHVVSPGSDVVYIFTRILPELSPGVVVHVHDICLPFETAWDWTFLNYRFWNEQYLLHTFLVDNKDWEVLFMGALWEHYLVRLMQKFLPLGGGNGSFWMRKRKPKESSA